MIDAGFLLPFVWGRRTVMFQLFEVYEKLPDSSMPEVTGC